MNDLFYSLGIESWKPMLGMLVMPPIPFLILVLAGARLMFRRRLLAWSLVLLGCVGIWLSCTTAAGSALLHGVLKPPRALSPSEIGELKRAPKTAIVVLGGGRKLLAPEYGVSMLKRNSLDRLRYGLYLAKETGLPIGFSGGVGHGSPGGPSEAEIAARTAEREYGRTLRWVEGTSRDTNENALRSLELLKADGIEHIVLVTEAYHMRRSLGAFERASQRTGKPMRVTPAPMDLDPAGRLGWSDWIPSIDGFTQNRLALHEILGLLFGA